MIAAYSPLTRPQIEPNALLNSRRSTFNLVLLLLATSIPVTWLAWRAMSPADQSPTDRIVPIEMQIDGGRHRIDLVQNPEGTFSYIVDRNGQNERRYTPDQLAARVFGQEKSRSWIERLFNISGPIGIIWVGLGLLGQLLFTGRMIVQWLATERNRQSTVPPIFWWMSLIGAMLLLTYFMWRRDIVGVLGQSFGLIVYIRNLYFIHTTWREIKPIKPESGGDDRSGLQ